MTPEVLSALIGGVSGIVCAVITAWMAGRASKKQGERDRSANAAYLTSQIAPALRDYAAMCLSVSYDDGHSEGQPAGKHGEAEIIVQSPTFIPSNFPVEWKSLPTDLMIEMLTFQEHARAEASVLDEPHGYYDPPNFVQFFRDRQHIYALLGIKALSLAERLYEHTGRKPHKRGTDIQEQLSTRLTELIVQRDLRKQHISEYQLSTDKL